MQPESNEPEIGELEETAGLADSNEPTLFDDFEVIGINETDPGPDDLSDSNAESAEVVHEATATEGVSNLGSTLPFTA